MLLLYKVGSQRVNIDLKLLNHKELISVYPYWLDTIGLVYPGLLRALVVVPMLVQSCLDAFLAAVVEVKDSLRASPRVLFRCCFSSRPTSRSSLAPVPLGSAIFPSELSKTSRVDIRLRPLDSLESAFGVRAARPTSRLFQGPRAHRLYIYYCKKLNSLKHLVRTTVAELHN